MYRARATASARACVSGLPTSCASSRARSSTRSRTLRLMSQRIRPRSVAVIAPQGPSSADCAAVTAASISVAPPLAMLANRDPSEGFVNSSVSRPSAERHSPPIRISDGSNQIKSVIVRRPSGKHPDPACAVRHRSGHGYSRVADPKAPFPYPPVQRSGPLS